MKLTMWYLLIIMLVSIFFSAVIYKVLTSEIDRFEKAQRFRIERKLEDEGFILPSNRFPRFENRFPLANPELLEETRGRILFTLVVINSVIFLISGGLGYVLAGRTLKPIQLMVDEQNKFISDASHELRTPLTALKTSMEVHLRDNKMTLEDARENLNENVLQVNRLQSLTDKLMVFNQYSNTDQQIIIKKYSLEKIIMEAIKQVKPLTMQKEIKIETHLVNLDIDGDRESLINLFVILLDNAIKYNLRKHKIIINTVKKDGSIEVLIKDNGIGIDTKDISHVFDRFYRADSARLKTEANGYGLGLSIAKRIIDLHNGSINIKSKLKKGYKNGRNNNPINISYK